MKQPNVAVVVLNYKGWQDTLVCIESLFNQTYSNFHIILIENGSHDNSAQELRKLKDERLTLIEESVNHGFTGGVNIGITWALEREYDAIVLFNNDARANKDWLERLVAAHKKTQASIVTGLLLSEDGATIDDAGDEYSTWGIPALRAENKPAESAPPSGYIFGATGGATLYSAQLFQSIGLFDNEFFAYNEDVDISWRAQIAGHKVYYENTALAYHKHSATSKKMPGFTSMQVCKNLPLVVIKNVPFPMIIPIGVRFLLIYWAFLLHKTLRGDAKPAFTGAFKSIALWPHALRERRRIQKTKVVTNTYIRSILHKGLPLRSIRRIKHFFKKPFDKGKEFDY